jgi:hypothetical protein
MNLDNDYKIWITSLKDKIRNAQIKASIAVNEQMIMLFSEAVTLNLGEGV